jgi:hypothetical protein
MPISQLQKEIAKVLIPNRNEMSYIAGATPLNFEPQTLRFSYDIDIFHDSLNIVGKAFEDDLRILKTQNFQVDIEIKQPGYIKATVSKKKQSTKMEWAYDSSFRFLPVVKSQDFGYVLHPVDLAINKVLALVGRNEARDYLDVHECHKRILPLGALVWAACGKDPGFNPNSIIELMKRRGTYRPDDFKGLNLTREINLESLKTKWLQMIDDCENYVSHLPPKEVGCLYYSTTEKRFLELNLKAPRPSEVLCHYGKPGGRVIPVFGG